MGCPTTWGIRTTTVSIPTMSLIMRPCKLMCKCQSICLCLSSSRGYGLGSYYCKVHILDNINRFFQNTLTAQNPSRPCSVNIAPAELMVETRNKKQRTPQHLARNQSLITDNSSATINFEL